jgi:VanZ family protein
MNSKSNERYGSVGNGYMECMLGHFHLPDLLIESYFYFKLLSSGGGAVIVEKQNETQQLALTWLVLGIAMMTVLTWINGRPEAAGLLHMPWDKVAHGLIFGGLTLIFGLSARGRWRWVVLLFMTAFAVFDEWRQLFLPGRTASLWDFAADMSATVAVLWLVLPWLLHRERCRV